MLLPLVPLLLAVQADAAPQRVLVLDFQNNGVDDASVRSVTELVASGFARHPQMAVTSGEDLRTLLRVEGAKEAAGCADGDSCYAELAGALGAQLVVSGAVGKLGDVWLVTISVYDAAAQASRAKVTLKDRDLGGLPAQIDDAVNKIAGTPAPAPSSISVPGVITTSAGALLLLGGGGAALASYVVSDDPESKGGDKELAVVGFPAGIVAGVVGAAAVAGGVALIAMGGE